MHIQQYDVIILNDDSTPFDLVCYILEEVFSLTSEEANKKALEIHNKGKAVVGTYIYEIAIDKQYQASMIARANGYVLDVVLENSSDEKE